MAALNEFCRETVLVQDYGQGETGNSSTDDQNSFNVSYHLLHFVSTQM